MILAFLGATDLLAASMTALTAIEYWSSQTPVRLLLLFALSGWTYWTGAGSMSMPSRMTSGPAQLLQTDLVFTIAFIELCLWFWVFVSLRDERRAVADKLTERRAFEDKNQL